MKKLLMLILMLVCFSHTAQGLEQEMRGVWISSVYNLDYPSSPSLSAEQLKQEADALIEKAYNCGFTDIYLQVRPTCDALYISDIFPTSAYVCTEQGAAFPDNFDILDYYIKKSSEKGIKVHAWINPYRITRGSFATKEEALASLSENNPALRLSDHIVFHSDGNLYFDPSSQEVRQLIIDGALEIVNKYDVAGIHLDDYFYPSADFDDTKSYEAGKNDGEELHAFRVRQVDTLIYSLYDNIKAADENCLFGVSPFGVWANKSSNPEGSNTISSQSYYDHYADTLKWVRDEKLDYIMPQLYWNIGNAEADYSELLSWWEQAVSGKAVKLYTGLAAYRIPGNELGYTADEIERQIVMNTASDSCSGFCIFRMNSIDDTLSETLASFTGDGDIYIATAHDDFQTDLPRFHFYGQASGRLYINGKAVDTSADGYFSVSKPLVYGKNTFNFVSGSSRKTISIYRNYSQSISPTVYDFTHISDGQKLTVPFYACKVNGSFFGHFDPEAILYEYTHDTAFSVSVTKDDANVYENIGTSEGAVAVLPQETKWTVTASQGDFYHLEDLGWIKKDNCQRMNRPLSAGGKVTSLTVSDTDNAYIIRMDTDGKAYPVLTETESGYSLHISGVSDITAPLNDLPNSSVTLSSSGLVISFTPALDNDISGYLINIYDDYFEVTLRKKPLSGNPDLPLENISFLLDAGHGGDQSGALSCSPEITEKDINLQYVLLLGHKLSALGAEVLYTRNDDSDISLDDRYKMASDSDAVFISLHSDSVGHAVPDTAVSGISLHVNNRHSFALAQHISENMEANYTSQRSDLYMAKPKNTYSILIENQFVCSPESFKKLISDEYKESFTDELCKALCDFFAA